jgi:glycerate-2-kinase
MAKVGLVWVLAVLGALFMAMSAQGQHRDGGYALSDVRSTTSQHLSAATGDAPRTAGLALTLLVLGGGATVLVVGATRGGREPEPAYAAEAEPVPDLSLALGLALQPT